MDERQLTKEFDEYGEPLDDEEDWLCYEEGGAGPCRHMACDDWGGDGLCLRYLEECADRRRLL